MRFSAAQVGHSKARPSASLKSLRERQGGLAMAGRRTAPQVVLSESERSELKGLAGRRKTAQAMANAGAHRAGVRGRLQSKQVAARLGVDEATVGKWRRRFAEKRLNGLYDEPRSGTPRTVALLRLQSARNSLMLRTSGSGH
jgi:hypothetical protein